MRYIDEYRNPEYVKTLAAAIRSSGPPPMTLMEVCGTHTMAIGRCGVRSLLPPQIRLISGPGCPVCVTPQADVDAFLSMSVRPDVTLVTFGDMLRVRGSGSSLEVERTKGADVRIVYSPWDALEIARRNPEREVVFFGVGFETTAPGVALTIAAAKKEGLRNFSVFCVHKTIPAALSALLQDGLSKIDGFLLPGHVSAVIGRVAYEPALQQSGAAGVISGFEPVDILQSILMLSDLIRERRAVVENQYRRAVTDEGNPAALDAMCRVFEPCDSDWRGLGRVPSSGLKIRSDWGESDALIRFGITERKASQEPDGCLCGEILKGQADPPDCSLFGTQCSPARPVGPCMVSSEGTCAAWHRYGGDHRG